MWDAILYLQPTHIKQHWCALKSSLVSYWMNNLQFICHIKNVLLVAWNWGMGIIVHSRMRAFKEKSNLEVSRDASLINWWDQSLFDAFDVWDGCILKSNNVSLWSFSKSRYKHHTCPLLLLRSWAWKRTLNTCSRLVNNPHINVLESHGKQVEKLKGHAKAKKWVLERCTI